MLRKLSPKNTRTGKIYQPHEIAQATAITRSNTPKPFQPRYRPFHYPAAGLLPRQQLFLLLAAPDMLFKTIYIYFYMYPFVVITFVQAEMTFFPSQKPCPHFTGIVQGRLYQTAVMDIGSRNRHPQWDSLTIHMQMNLAAFPAPVRRISPQSFIR